MQEMWKDIPDYEGLYQASNLGRVRTHPNKTTHTERHGTRHWKVRVMKPKWESRNRCASGHKDARLELWKDGKHRTMLVARLIAMSWVDGYAEGLTVNHIDGNPANNRADNLEWITHAENISKGFADGLYSASIKCSLQSADGTVYQFRSMQEACAFLGRSHSYIFGKKNKQYVSDTNGHIYKLCMR